MSEKTVLAGTDFSEISLNAMREAASFAERLKYGMALVNVIDSHDQINTEAVEDRLEEIASGLRDEYGISVDTDVYTGNPGKTLARLSREEQYGSFVPLFDLDRSIGF